VFAQLLDHELERGRGRGARSAADGDVVSALGCTRVGLVGATAAAAGAEPQRRESQDYDQPQQPQAAP